MPKIQSNGINLYYEIHGEGQPLLLIHGLGSSARDWEMQVDEFAKSFRVITLDLRGHGQSDQPRGPYSLSMFAADTVGLLKGLGSSRRTWSGCLSEAWSRFNWRWTRPFRSSRLPS